MADRKISDLTALTAPASGDYVPIVDISEAAAASKNKRVTIQSLFQGIPVNVGIGTASPGSTLHLYGGPAELRVESSTASEGFIRFINTSGSMSIGMTGATSNAFLLYDRTNSHSAYHYNGGASGSHIWYTNNAERLRVDSSGRVGIGTSSPGTALEVNGAAKASYSIASGNLSAFASSSGGLYTYFSSGASVIQSAADNSGTAAPLLFISGSERLRVDSSGRVGIGTTSPTTLLDVSTDTVRVRTARTPASASATGATGEICWDASYIYVCTATNTWKRAALSTW